MKSAPIRKIKTEKIHVQVYEQIKTLLLAGYWKSGEKILSENELCKMTGVSRMSVRTAIKSLIAQGFLVSRQGEGTFVENISADLNMNVLVPILGLMDRNILEVLEYRKILEVGLIPKIFQNITQKDKEVLKKNIEEMENTPETEIEKITELDLEFHRKLSGISGNSLVIRVSQILDNLFWKAMQDTVITLGNQIGRCYHRKIFDAILSNDLELTKSILEEHIQDTIDSIQQLQHKNSNDSDYEM